MYTLEKSKIFPAGAFTLSIVFEVEAFLDIINQALKSWTVVHFFPPTFSDKLSDISSVQLPKNYCTLYSSKAEWRLSWMITNDELNNKEFKLATWKEINSQRQIHACSCNCTVLECLVDMYQVANFFHINITYYIFLWWKLLTEYWMWFNPPSYISVFLVII